MPAEWVVLVSGSPWAAAAHRQQAWARELSRDRRVLFVDPPDGCRREFAVRRLAPTLWLAAVPAPLPFPGQLPASNTVNRRLAARQVRRWLDDRPGDRILWIDDATAESERLVAEATAHAAELVRRAAAQAHARVSDADNAVQELTTLRGHVLGQLASLREHLGQIDKLAASGPALLDPPAAEAGRPVTGDFPADPDARPTGLPKGFDEEPGPWDDVTVESLRAEQPGVVVDAPASEAGAVEPHDDGQPESEAESTDDKLNAIAANFDRGEPSPGYADTDTDTDTFARVADAEDRPAVPAQQRTGLKAFADRAMGR